MNTRTLLLLLGLGLAWPSSSPANSTAADPKFWSQWRGPLASGVAPLADPPLTWSETNNVKWKVKIPGFGTSTPIIWENRVFILTAVPTGKKVEPKEPAAAAPPPEPAGNPEGGQRRGRGGGFASEKPTESHRFVVLCLDRATGKVLWEKTAREEVPHEGHHRDHGYASASPVTDGKVLVAHFGSRGLYCYDLEGNLKWEKDLGDMRTRNGFGEGSSPALHGDTVVVLWDHEGEDFIVALDKNTGKELWRTPRDEPSGWCTPLIVEHAGRRQVIVNATGKVRSYDLANGRVLWECAGQTANAIPSAVAAEGVAYVTSGFRGSALQAIKLDGKGDLTGTDAILWSHNRNTPYVPSPLLFGDALYFVKGNEAMLSCFEARTGKPVIDGERIEGIRGVYASPVAARDRIYLLGRDGATVVLKKGSKLEVLATNKLDDKTDASIALVGRELFIRGHQYLYCIAE
ncbi:MAG TPA: PQQ-binding-like beta-propeller repeat protein [Methylomirabilota bacterium]|nr:PQQ-binding-like beta-propeller repeat protein [Methylomirabilota bacterium]